MRQRHFSLINAHIRNKTNFTDIFCDNIVKQSEQLLTINLMLSFIAANFKCYRDSEITEISVIAIVNTYHAG